MIGGWIILTALSLAVLGFFGFITYICITEIKNEGWKENIVPVCVLAFESLVVIGIILLALGV